MIFYLLIYLLMTLYNSIKISFNFLILNYCLLIVFFTFTVIEQAESCKILLIQIK